MNRSVGFEIQTIKRLDEIDMLRAVAILLVLGRHVLIVPKQGSVALAAFVSAWKNFGWIGVDLFFVLSGFLISGLLFREFLQSNSINAGRFIIRRALKLYPAFYFFLLVGTCAIYPLTNATISWKGILGEAFYLQNYVGSLWLHTWSLAVEEHFYLILVFTMSLMLGGNRIGNPFKHIPAFFLLIASANLFARAYIGYFLTKSWGHMLFPTHLRIDSLLFGVVLSYYYHFHPDSLRRFFNKYSILIFSFSLLAISPPFFLDLERSKFLCTFGLSLLYMGFGGILLFFLLSQSPIKALLVSKLKILGPVGRHSYSIYLWHIAIFVVAIKAIPFLGLGAVTLGKLLGLYVAGSILFGIGMSKLVEQPVLRIRNKIFPSSCGNLSETSQLNSR